MAMIKQTQPFGASRLTTPLFKGFTAFVAGIGRLAGDPTGDIVLAPRANPGADARAVQLFAQALHEASNLELDWLWYATHMTSDAQRRYCIERALNINPDSALAKRALAKLSPL